MVIFSYSQDTHYSLLKNSSIYLNPAFSGNDRCGRIVFLYQNKYFRLGGFHNIYVSYDQPINKIYGNIGIRTMYNYESNGVIRTQSEHFSYSSNIKLFNKNLVIKPAIEFGFIHKKIDFVSSSFNSTHPLYGPVYTTGNSVIKESLTFFDLNSGLLFFHNNLIYGLSIHHIYQPESESNFNISSRRYLGHISYNWILNENIKISPLLLYSKQQNYEFYSIQISANIFNLLTSVGYGRNKQFYISYYNFNIGYKFRKLSIGGSYLLTKSGLRNATLGVFELNISMNLKDNDKKTKSRDSELLNY